MDHINKLFELLNCDSEKKWSDMLCSISNNHGFEQIVYGVISSRHIPLEHAFLRSNYSAEWRSKYDSEKFHYIDPTVTHCLESTIPLVWQPKTFNATPMLQNLYEEACGHGIRSGISFPIHGANGEFGVISFATDAPPGKRFSQDVVHFMPSLSLIRDYVFESSLKFVKAPSLDRNKIHITHRELEALKWAMAGKTSWEISKIMNCAEVTVNFHLTNVRSKFKVATRQQAVIKAIRMGLITPSCSNLTGSGESQARR